MPFGIMNLMDWMTIREAFKDARAASELNQADLKNLPQPMVSKIENNGNLGPTVETFVKALHGLRIPVWKFFAKIEGLTPAEIGDHETPPDIRIQAAAIRRLSRRIVTLERRIASLTRLRKKNRGHASATRALAAERRSAGRVGDSRNPPRADKRQNKD